MNIWIFNHHALLPTMSGGTRHYDFAKELVKRGHQVTIIASSFHYSKYEEMKQYGSDEQYIQEEIDGIVFIWIKTIPYFNNGIKRVQNMLDYTLKSLKIIPRLNLQKPDIIIGSSVHLFAVYAAYRFAKKYDVPFIMEVRDIWPQTLIDLGVSKWHPFVIVLKIVEKYLYKKADKIISNLPYAYKHIEKFVSKEKCVWISNGVDLQNIEYIKQKEHKHFIVSYTGAIGIANNLTLLVKVAERLTDKKDIFFQIIGDGAQKEILEEQIKQKGLKNIVLKKSVPKEQVAKILQESDLLFVALQDSPLYKFGMSLNKLFDYMAAGRVILFATNIKKNPIVDSQGGFVVDADNIDLLEEKLLEIYHLSLAERNKIGYNARKYVEQHYSIEVLTDKLENLLQKEIEKFHADKKNF